MKLLQKGLLILLLVNGGFAYGQLTEDPEQSENQGREPLRTQTPEGRPLPFVKRLRFGGGITGLSIGNPFSIGLSPVVAYQASEHAIIGLGINYFYYRAKLYYQNGPTQIYRANQYGGRLFGLYEILPSIIPSLYVHGELETTNVAYTDYAIIPFQTHRRWVSSPMIGITYTQPITQRFGVNLSALYNVNYNATHLYSPYNSPWVFRVSFF